MPRSDPPDPATDQTGPFPETRATHDRILDDPGDYPPGWVEQARFRERYDLPPFRPPRFSDDVTVADVVASLADELDVSLSLVAYDVRTDGWWIEIDGTRGFRIPRHRDDAANTVIEMTADEFEARVTAVVEGSALED